MWYCPNCARQMELAALPDLNWKYNTCNACGFDPTGTNGILYFAPKLADPTEGFDPTFFRGLEQIEETNFWFVNRARLLVALLKEHFPAAESVLEVGCGTGSVLLALRRAIPTLRLAGSELHAPGLEIARKRLDDVLLLQMDARKIPARSEFDVIGAFDVLEHIAEDDVVLEQIHAALRPGGGLLVSVPQHPWLWSQSDDAAHHVRRYCRGELERKLAKTSSGFRILRSTSFNSLLLPLMMASRLVLRRKPQADPLAELRVSGWLNWALSCLLRLEVELTKCGLNWPFGGSRVIVAQRL